MDLLVAAHLSLLAAMVDPAHGRAKRMEVVEERVKGKDGSYL